MSHSRLAYRFNLTPRQTSLVMLLYSLRFETPSEIRYRLDELKEQEGINEWPVLDKLQSKGLVNTSLKLTVLGQGVANNIGLAAKEIYEAYQCGVEAVKK